LERDEEKLGIKIPFPFPFPPKSPEEEERVRPDVVIAAIAYKLLRELREFKETLRTVLTVVGEVFPVEATVYRDAVAISPGGLWRGVNIYNRGPSTCYVQLSRKMLSQKPVRIEPGASKSWFFSAPVIKAVYAKSVEKSVLELEFTR